MSRLRATLAKSEIDRKIATRLHEAERAVLAALGECDQHGKKAATREETLRARKVSRDLKRVLAVLTDVRRVHSGEVEPEVPRASPIPVPAPGPVPVPIRTQT